MKKVFGLFCVFALSMVLLCAPAQAQTTFGFKVTGGMGYLSGGDVNTGLQGWSDAWSALFGGAGYSLSGGYSPFHLGMDIGGEFLIQFNPSLAIGLGAGFMQASKSSTLTMSGFGASVSDTWAPNASAIPITATFYYFLPSSSPVKIFLDAGVGYYLGKYKDTWHIVFFGTVNESLDTTANGIGFHGGLGIEVPLSPAISFLAEARGRYASLGGFKGTEAGTGMTVTGNVWLLDVTGLGSGTHTLITVDDVTPVGTNVRQAKLDMSGFSAVVGFLFHF